MNYTAEIVVHDNHQKIYRCLHPEVDSKTKRSKVSLKKADGRTKIIVDAKDATSLRASTNGILRSLIIYEKMKSIKND